MRLKNTSKYPDGEVRRLVEFGMKGVRTAGLAVNVKNCSGAYAGRAYERVPLMSPRSRQRSVERLVTIRIGAPARFPVDNMTTSMRWHDGPVPEGVEPAGWKTFSDGRSAQWAERVRHPYGGKRSPLITCLNWREGLLVVAAHEARHVWQYQHDKPRSEVDCERFAAKALERYRQELAG